jgi:FtsX-like permease family
MRAIISVAVHRLRASWRAWAALVVLTGLTGGVVMTAAAGARRTENAYPQFLRSTAAADVLVGPARSGVGGFDFAIGGLPGVSQIAPVVGLNCLPVSAHGKIDEAAEIAAPLDGRLGRQLERPKMLAGRPPSPNRAGEVMVDQIAARVLGVHVGSLLRLAALNNDPKIGIRYLTEHVVGIEVIQDSIVPVNKLAQTAYIQASLALYRELGPGYQAFDGDYVKLSPGTTVAAFTAEATHLAREARYRATGGQLFVSNERVQAATVERAVRPQAVALAIFSLVLGLTALLILGQAASRLMEGSSADNPVLAALGLTRWQLLAASLIEVLAVVGASALLACVVAIVASPLMPIGPTRLADLHPGVSVDATVLATGSAAIIILLLGRVAWAAWRESSVRLRGATSALGAPGYGSRAARWLAGSGAPVTAVTGVRMALEPGRGRGAVPAHGALVGTALAVAAFMAAVTFGANLGHLERTPRLYGKTWDIAMDLQFGVIGTSQFDGYVKSVPGLTAWTFGLHGTVNLGRRAGVVPAIGLAQGRGRLLTPTILRGHAPAAGQLVLGTSTMRDGAFRLGQIVDVSASGPSQPLAVVGRAVFPYFGQGSFTPTDLGAGALVPASLLAAQAQEANGDGYNFVLLKFAPGPRKAADIAAFKRAIAKFCARVQQSTCVVTNQQPNGVINYEPVDATPLILAGLLAVLGLGVLAQFAFQSARSRRRDFAVLRTLGLRRHQLSAVMLWQISTVTGLALLIGLPVGAAAGHWAWALFADALGISPAAGVPIATGLLLIPAVLLAANAIALWPASGSTRVRPAHLLRAE